MGRIIQNPKTFGASILFIAFGAVAVALSRKYTIGTLTEMGPGYFPSVLGFLLIGIGLLSLARALVTKGEPIAPWAWKTVLIICLSPVIFGLTLIATGFVPASLFMVAFAALASREFPWRPLPLIGMFLFVVATGLLFIKALGVPLEMLAL